MPLIPFYAARRSLLRVADGLRAVDFFKAVAVIFGVGLLSAAWAESPDIAGRVQFVVGEVSAADRDGATRALGKRDDIFEGDTVTTGPSASAQIMMIDGARIAVRPNSAFMVNEYRAPSADDIGASILTLLKGGFRTLSGLIGEESAQYRIDTPCCAIGLRGTDHAVFHIPAGEEDAYGGGAAGTYNKVYKGATFLESAGVTLDITPQTDAGFAARGQPPVFVPDIPETAEGAVVLAPSEDEDEESDESEAAENESEESESEDESESETETADADDSNSESDDAESESETADADDSNSETETAETADADDSNSGSDDAVLAESPADESSSEIDDAVLAESPADESSSEIDNAGLAESPADESPSEIDNAGLVESPGELSSALETVEIAIESAAPPIADFQNPADIADALQRENTMPEPEPPSPVISLTSDLTMLQEGGQVILRISSDIAAPSGGLMVTINIGTAMAGEFGISGGVCSALECVVVIPAGMLAATLTITPISDTAMESAERWTATLVDGGLNYNIDNTMMDVGFDISDQPVIGIATADMAMVREGGEIRLTVSSDIAAPSGGLMVTINIGTAMAGEFGIAGGDCTALECVVVIPAGMLAATLTITPISDTAMESAERWTATLVDGGLNYNIDTTMMDVGFDISDQPVIGIATADMAMVREGGEIRLTVSSDIAAPSGGLMVTINIGTAMAGEFGISGGVCSALECVVTIPAGMTEAELILTPISDTAMESAERWTATLVDGGLNYNIDTTMMDVGFDISDQPVIGIATADMAMVREGGEIRLTVSSDIAAPSGGLMVTINIGTAMAGEFGISGGVCSALECVVVIPAGMLAATLTITPISDTAMESAERWTATLVDGGLNYNIDNTMMDVGFDISDQPVIGIATADMAMVREGGEIRLTVSSDIAAPSGGLMVTINIGTAMAGEFGITGGVCSALECVVVIPAGMTEAELILTPISDSVNEDLENWMATLGDGGLNYNIDNTMMNVGFDISDPHLNLRQNVGTEVGEHDIALQWDAHPDATGYRVSRGGTEIGDVTGTSFTQSLQMDGDYGDHHYRVVPYDSGGDLTDFAVDTLAASRDGFLDATISSRLRIANLLDPALLVGGSIATDPNFPVGLEFMPDPVGQILPHNDFVIAPGQTYGEQQFSSTVDGVEYSLFGDFRRFFFQPGQRLVGGDSSIIWVDDNSGPRGGLILVIEGQSFPANARPIMRMFYRLQIGDRVMLRNYYLSMQVGNFFTGVTNVEDVALTGPETFFRVVGGGDCVLSNNLRCSKQIGSSGVEGLASFGLREGSSRVPFTRFDLLQNDGNRISGRLAPSYGVISDRAPRNLMGIVNSDGSVSLLRWDTVGINPAYSKIYRDGVEIGFGRNPDSSLRGGCAGDSLSFSSRRCTDSGTTPGATHRYTISSVDNFGRESPMSDPLEVTIPDLPVIGIATADMAIVREGGEIRLTVSSDIAARPGGLMVTINIGNAMAGEFGIAGGVCTALECVVVIPAGMLAATLTITPISDSVNEDLENWMATLGDGGLNYNIDNTMMNVGFDISDPLDPNDPILLAVVDFTRSSLDDAPHVQGHDVVLAWGVVTGFNDATDYRVYRDGVRADGEFTDGSLSVNNRLGPLSVLTASCDNVSRCFLDVSDGSDGSVNRVLCEPVGSCFTVRANVPGTSFIFADFGLFDAESGRIIGLFDGGVSHVYEIRTVDENGVETRVVGPIIFTAPAIVDNNLEDFVPANSVAVDEVNEYLPVLDAVMPSDFIIGNGGILASQTDVDVISGDPVFSTSDQVLLDFRAGTYEGTPDLGNLLGLDNSSRFYVYRAGGLNPALTSASPVAGIEEFTFSYAIEAGDVTRLTDYDVLIRPTGERWEFGLADGSRVDLTHAETFFDVAGTADLDTDVSGGAGAIDGIASFGSNNERVFSRFSVGDADSVLSGRFDIPAGNSE